MAFENLKKNGITYVLTKLKDVFVQIKDSVRSVNGNTADENGNITLVTVPYAQNLQSESNQRTNEIYIERTAGRTASIRNGVASLVHLKGNSIHTGYVPESIDMTVTPVNPDSAAAITATINETTFKQAVYVSGTTTLTYTDSWSEDPATYGITVTGTPEDGDVIEVVYVMEERGTISVANPMSLIATGWNLYNNDLGYARVLKYSDDPNERFGISGTYSTIKYSATLDGTQTAVTVTDGRFSIEADGYIFLTGGNATDTAVWMTWSDWDDGYDGEFAAYTENEVDFSNEMSEYFPYGLLKAGTAVDEINLSIGQAINRVERIAYSAANRILAEASGRQYEFDDDYIYLELEEAESHSISVSGEITVNDHGMEIITHTDIPVECEMLYGVNLKNRVEHDTVTISGHLANNFTTNVSGYALDARRGKALNDILAADTSADVDLATNKITKNYAKVFKIGNIVIVSVSASVTSAINTGSTLLSVPSGYRPGANVRPVFAYESNGTNERYRPDYFIMNSSGQISQSWSASWADGEFELVFIYHV